MSVPSNSTCPHCKLPLREYHDFVTCPSCQTSYHEKCWEENGGCTQCNIITETAATEAAENLSWYLYHGNRNLGPLTWEELCSQEGIQPDDLVWNSKLPDWIRADQLPDLPLAPGPSLSAEPQVIESTAPADSSPAEEEEEEEKEGAAPVESDWQPVADPVLPGSTLQWQQSGADHHFEYSADPIPESGDATAVEGGALPGVNPEEEEPAGPATLPRDGAVKWKFAKPAASPGRRIPALPGEGAEGLSRDPARTEIILDHLYGKQAGTALAEPSFLDREDDFYDERKERARRYARHTIPGTLLILAGLAAGGAAHIYTAHWESLYRLGAAAASGAIALFGIIVFIRGLCGWLKYRS